MFLVKLKCTYKGHSLFPGYLRGGALKQKGQCAPLPLIQEGESWGPPDIEELHF